MDDEFLAALADLLAWAENRTNGCARRRQPHGPILELLGVPYTASVSTENALYYLREYFRRVPV